MNVLRLTCYLHCEHITKAPPVVFQKSKSIFPKLHSLPNDGNPAVDQWGLAVSPDEIKLYVNT